MEITLRHNDVADQHYFYIALSITYQSYCIKLNKLNVVMDFWMHDIGCVYRNVNLSTFQKSVDKHPFHVIN